MILILIFLAVNFLIARVLVKLTIKLSTIYVQNSQILAPTIKKEIYEMYVKIYQDPNCLDNVILMHIPIFNLTQCFFAYIAILNAEEKLKK
jgi:hypothetical protein